MSDEYPNMDIDFSAEDERLFERVCGALVSAQKDRARYHYATICSALASEIEAMMAWALIAHCVSGGKYGFDLMKPEAMIRTSFILPQFAVDECRVDFMLSWSSIDPRICLAVECDGHDFHSTAWAKERDRRRDAFLQSQGVKVRRFSGSDIFAAPAQCAASAFEHLDIHRFTGRLCKEGIFR